MEIGQEGVAAVADPLDRPAESLCRPDDQHKLGAGVVADAEIAADIAGDHAHRIFGNAERAGNVVALPDHAAAGARVDGELRRDFIIGADRGAQFHRHAGDAVDRRL